MTTLSCHIEGVFFSTEISRFQTSRTPQLTFWDFSPNKKRWDSKWQVSVLSYRRSVFYDWDILFFEISSLHHENWLSGRNDNSLICHIESSTLFVEGEISLKLLRTITKFLTRCFWDFSSFHSSKWQVFFLSYRRSVFYPVLLNGKISRFQTSRTPQLTFWDFSPNKKRWDSKWQVF